jgi:hypothetical protein
VTCVKSAKEALVRLQTQQQQHQDPTTNSTNRSRRLLLIDMENEQGNIISLKLLIYHLRQGTVGNFVPLGKEWTSKNRLANNLPPLYSSVLRQ